MTSGEELKLLCLPLHWVELIIALQLEMQGVHSSAQLWAALRPVPLNKNIDSSWDTHLLLIQSNIFIFIQAMAWNLLAF